MKVVIFLFLFSFQVFGETLKLSVLAPEGTSWANSLKQMAQDVETKTFKRVQFKIYFGGSQGDEADVLKKIRIGQLHGSFFTGKTLGELSSDMRILEVPFTFGNNYPLMMSALKDVENSEFSKNLEKKSLKCLALFSLGPVYFVSTKKFTDIESLKGQKIWSWDGDKMTTAIIEELQFAPVNLSLPDVLPSLSTGMVQAAYAPPMGIIALQWHSKVKYLLDYPLAFSMGAFLVDMKVWNKLKVEDQKMLEESAKAIASRMTQDNKSENDEALKMMKRMGIEFLDLPEKDISRVEKVRKSIVEKLSKNYFSKEALIKLSTFKGK